MIWREHVLALVFFIVFFTVFFSPAIFSGRLLAPGDGMLYYLPHYQMPLTLWNPLSMTGFPEIGDPQLMKWYWPALLLSRIPGSWNVFVIAAYVFASWFIYLYVRALAAPGFAALVSGLVFGLCGFMIGHLGHASMIHTAAWVPCMLWAAEELRGGFRVRWILIGSIGASQSILGGHPQIAFYGFALVAAYVGFRSLELRPGWMRYCAANVSAILLGVMLSGVQILTTAAISSETTRAHMSFAQFSEYSLSVYQLVLLAFPCLFGGGGATYLDGIPFFAAWNLTEMAGYVGFAVPVLAFIGILARYRERVVLFWTGTGVVALLAALGPTTPVGHIVYALPGFGQFRAQGRFIFIFCLAMAVLAAQGISAISSRPRGRRELAVIAGSCLALLGAAVMIGPLFGRQLQAAAAAQGFPNLPVSVWGNRWITIPVGGSVLLSAALAFFVYRPAARWTRVLLFAGVVCELSTFGWYTEWRYGSPRSADMQPPAIEKQYAQKLREAGGRWLGIRGYLGSPQEAPSELAALWHLPAIGKYGPLQPARYRELLQIESNGFVFGNWWDPANRALDIAGARLVAFPEPPPSGREMFHDIVFPRDEINLMAGQGCGSTATGGKVEFQESKHATAVAVVSLMGCSTGIAQGTPVLEMRFQGAGGRSSTTVLRAGIDTAEWAAGCADVAPALRHRQAEVYSQFAVPRGANVCQGQRYAAVLPLPGGAIDVRSVAFRWLPRSEGVSRIIKLVFIDGAANKTEAVRPIDLWVGDTTRWKQFQGTNDILVYENLRAMPRAWLVPETRSLTAEGVKQAIQTSRLPDGRAYDPAASALLEQPLGFRAAPDPEAHAWVVDDRNSVLDVQTINRQPAFLVLADLYFPGWKVSVNGRPSRIFQTNYIQRGVLLPAGQNLVRFEFRPASFFAGLGLSAAGLLLSVLGAVAARVRGVL